MPMNPATKVGTELSPKTAAPNPLLFPSQGVVMQVGKTRGKDKEGKTVR